MSKRSNKFRFMAMQLDGGAMLGNPNVLTGMRVPKYPEKVIKAPMQ